MAERDRGDDFDIRLRITSHGCPVTLEGTVNGRPIWYRMRHTRWDLYEGTEAAVTGIGLTGHLTGDGVTWLSGGECDEQDAFDPLFALHVVIDELLEDAL